MSRDNGFTVADTATGLHHDPKVKKLWRILRDADRMSEAMALLEGIRLASWAEGDRVNADDGAPFWMSDIAAPLAALREAGLLDDENRIPQRSWDSWFGPANERREQRREAGRLGGTLSRPKQRLSDAEAALEQRLSDAEPVRTVPSVPTVPGSPSVTRANGKAHDEVPFVALSKEEREAVLQREQDELMRKIGWKVGVKS